MLPVVDGQWSVVPADPEPHARCRFSTMLTARIESAIGFFAGSKASA